MENGENKGFCTDIVAAVLKKAGLSARIRTYPWSRAYETALRKKNTLIYTIARTPERENLFHWIGVIVSGKTYLFSRKQDPIVLDSLEQARTYRIGAVRDGIRAKYLASKGFDHLDLVEDTRTNAVKLINRRIDLWVEDELSANYTMRKLGVNPDAFIHKAFGLDLKLDGYMAFSRDTDQALVALFRRTLESLIQDGTYDKIKRNYL